MRAPDRRRAERRRVAPEADLTDLTDLAERSTLEPGGPRPSETLTPADDPARLAGAFGDGRVAGPWEDGFPRYAWYYAAPPEAGDPAEVTEFRLTGTRPGEYVGYRLPPSYWPEGLQ